VDALLDALDAQVKVGEAIGAPQLVLATPCADWSVRDVMNHSIGVTLKFAEFASGATDRPHAPSGDLLGPDHVAALRSCRDAARAAWASADMTRSCELPFGSFPASVAAGINLFDVLAHSWDIAAAAEVELDCPDDLWEVGLEAARAVIGTDRDPAHYAPEIRARPNAGGRERFLCFVGRGTFRA
jgi:uncharacterized protein (TIGR03086 family)